MCVCVRACVCVCVCVYLQTCSNEWIHIILKMVGEEFSKKPYALAVQQGSPLKDQLNDA